MCAELFAQRVRRIQPGMANARKFNPSENARGYIRLRKRSISIDFRIVPCPRLDHCRIPSQPYRAPFRRLQMPFRRFTCKYATFCSVFFPRSSTLVLSRFLLHQLCTIRRNHVDAAEPAPFASSSDLPTYGAAWGQLLLLSSGGGFLWSWGSTSIILCDVQRFCR